MNVNKRLTRTIAVVMMGYSAAVAVLPVVLGDLVEEFALEGGRIGLASSFSSIGVLLALLIFSPLIQGRLSKRTVLAVSGISAVVILVLAGYATKYKLLLGCHFMLGILLGGFFDSFANSYIVDLNYKNSGRYVSLLHACYGFGGLIAPVLFSQILLRTDRYMVYFAAAMLLMVTLLPFLITSALSKKPKETEQREVRLSKDFVRLFFIEKRNWMLLLAIFFYCAIQNTHILWVMRYISVELDAPKLSSLALAGYWICSTLCRLFVSYLPGKPLTKFTVALIPVAICFCLGLFVRNAIAMIVVSCLFGLLAGHSIPTLINECARHYKGATTFPTIFMILAMHAASIVMPPIMGGISKRFSLRLAMFSLPAMALCAFIIGTFLLINSKRVKEK